MEMQVSDIDQVTKVALSGRLDSAGASQIEMRFTAVIVPKGQPAIVDLSEVSFLASLGVRLIISTARALLGKGRKLALYGANPTVMEIIETTALHEIVLVAGSEGEAIGMVKA